MQNMRKVFVALCIGSSVLGCNSNSNSHPAISPAPANNTGTPAKHTTPSEVTHNPPNWVLKLESKCQENVTPDQCVGAYGLTILTDGHYVIGPGPQGELHKGTLTSDEIDHLHAALDATLNASHLSSENHDTLNDPVSDDTLTLTRGDNQDETLLRTTGSDFYFTIDSASDAKTLYKDIRELLTKYYTLPFPDACLDGTTALQALYASVQSCTTDADCSYIDNTFTPVEATSTAYLTTDDCSLVLPLVVANASSVRTSQGKLNDAFDRVRNVCQDRLVRADCTGVTGFQLTGANAPAVCRSGTCQVNSSFHSSIR